MIKLATLLKEIGENTANPYPFSAVELYPDMSRYAFETDSGIVYRVINRKLSSGSDIQYDVSFAVVNFKDKESTKKGEVNLDYKVEVNDPKNLFRVMATVIDIIKKDISEDETEKRDDETGDITKKAKKVRKIYMTPIKRQIKEPGSRITMDDPSDYRRYKLYRAFIKNNAPIGSSVEDAGSETVINLPEERPLKWKQS